MAGKIWKVIKLTLLSLLALIVVLAVGGLGYRAFRLYQSNKAMAIAAPNGIDEAMFIEVRGTREWITIRGRNRSNPVVLMLHGGPGVSQVPMAPAFLPFESDFTIVQWDQPGTAKSFAAAGSRIDPGLTSDVIAQDGIAVTRFLKTHLNKGKIILLGWSWGTVVGVKMARKQPDLFAAYVGTGQAVGMRAGEPIVYRRVLETARAQGNQQAIAELEGIGPPPYDTQAELGTQRKWAMKFAGDGNPIAVVLQLALLGPRYSVRDAWSYLSGAFASQNHFIGLNMEGEFMKIDLAAEGLTFDVPMFVIQGLEDNLTPASVSRAFVERLAAPQKAFIGIDGAGHMALVRNTDQFLKIMIERVRPLAVP